MVDASASLVVMGSEELARSSSALVGSFSLTIVKTLTFVSVLVIKANTSGECHKLEEPLGEYSKIDLSKQVVQ